MCVVMASFICFYALDRLISALFARRGEVHSHTHMANAPDHSHPDLSQLDPELSSSNNSSEEFGNNKKLDLKLITSLGWMNLFSDGIHNFVDGIALGAAWSVSLSLGLGTSLAILFHEIPQEISDFSILVKSGFPRRWALLFNLFSGIPAILGLVIAIPIAQAAESAQYWVLAVTAGGFFYIAFVLLLPELLARQFSVAHQLEVSFGMILGFVALLLLAIYEEQIVFRFCFTA